MSKEAAMALATGQPQNNVSPSLITGDMGRTETGLNPGISPAQEIPQNENVKAVLDSDRFAILAKQEAKRVREMDEFKKEKVAFEEERSKLRGYVDKINAFEEKRKSDPVAALKDIGFSETEVFNFLAAQEKKEATPEEVARAVAEEQIKNFKDEQAKIAQDAQKARDQGLVKNYQTQISSTIKSSPDKYEYANFYGPVAEELAMEFAKKNIEINGELLTPDEIAQAIEDYYEESDKAMSNLKKRQPKIEAQSTQGQTNAPERTRTLAKPMSNATPPAPAKTLTNKSTATVASTITRRETYEQKKERLISALKNGQW